MNHDGKAISPIFLILIGFLVLTVASALVPARFIGLKQPRSSYTPIDYTKLKTVEEFTKDADNDGKITWRELVESNVDDPTVPIVEEGDTPDPEIAKALSDPNNLTASLTKNLYVTSVYLKNNNITDEESQRRAMEGLTQEEIDKTVSKKYLPPDIKVAKTEDRTTIKAYGNEMAKILGNLISKKNIEEDLPGVILFTQKADEATLAPIIADSKRVDGIFQKLLLVSVPPSAVIYHLIALNQVVIYRDTLSNLSKAATDPVRAAITIQKYPDTLVATLQTYKTLSDYFNLKNIAFSPNEPGYIYTVGYTLK